MEFGSGHDPLIPFYYVSLTSVIARMVLPLLCAWLVLGSRPSEFGYRVRLDRAGLAVYGGLAIGGICLALWAGTRPDFLATYPRSARAIVDGRMDGGVFLTYQLAYFMFFVAGESFWRGYLLFGLEPQFGRAAVYLSLVPYVILHFGKPQLEALGAIGAGIGQMLEGGTRNGVRAGGSM